MHCHVALLQCSLCHPSRPTPGVLNSRERLRAAVVGRRTARGVVGTLNTRERWSGSRPRAGMLNTIMFVARSGTRRCIDGERSSKTESERLVADRWPQGTNPTGHQTPSHQNTKLGENYNGYPLTCSQTLCCSRTKVVCSSLVHTQTFMQTRRCRCTR